MIRMRRRDWSGLLITCLFCVVAIAAHAHGQQLEWFRVALVTECSPATVAECAYRGDEFLYAYSPVRARNLMPACPSWDGRCLDNWIDRMDANHLGRVAVVVRDGTEFIAAYIRREYVYRMAPLQGCALETCYIAFSRPARARPPTLVFQDWRRAHPRDRSGRPLPPRRDS